MIIDNAERSEGGTSPFTGGNCMTDSKKEQGNSKAVRKFRHS